MNTTLSMRVRGSDAPMDAAIGQRIFEKLCVRMAALEHLRPMPKFNTSKTPDVVVYVDNQAVLFEPQNWPATKWLYNRCNLSLDGARIGERVGVHPCQWQKILDELRTSGFEVLC